MADTTSLCSPKNVRATNSQWSLTPVRHVLIRNFPSVAPQNTGHKTCKTLGRTSLSSQKVWNGRGQGRITAQAAPSYPLEWIVNRKVQRKQIRCIGRCYPAPGIYHINRPMIYAPGYEQKVHNRIIRSNKVPSYSTNPRAVRSTGIIQEDGSLQSSRRYPWENSANCDLLRARTWKNNFLFTAVTSNYLFVTVA